MNLDLLVIYKYVTNIEPNMHVSIMYKSLSRYPHRPAMSLIHTMVVI